MQQLPKFHSKLFKWFCEPAIYEELQGDLEEAFMENVQLCGLSKAQKIYKKEVLRMIRPSVLKHFHLLNKHIMTLPKNYLKTSIRAIKLHPFYVFANVFGLALALSICTIGYFNYRSNATFNTYFGDAEDIYKVHGVRTAASVLGQSALPIGPQLSAKGIDACRHFAKTLNIKDGNYLFTSRIAFVDPNFLALFPFEDLQGKLLKMPTGNEIIISDKLALRLFDEVYPLGKTVKIVFPNLQEESFIVSGIFDEPPTNTSFRQDAILPISVGLERYHLKEGDWRVPIDGTFVKCEHNELNQVVSELNQLVSVRNRYNESTAVEHFRLDNMLDWPACERDLYRGTYNQHLHPSSVWGIAGSALTILFLACFNFINTSIALSGKRLKEIGVRKVLGGTKASTATQFLIENSFMIFLAVILSFGISYLLVPSYNALFQQELIQLDKIPITDFLAFGVFIILIVAVLAAAYPSLYVSKFPALKIFANKVALSGKNRVMSVLLTLQFALCFYNIFGLFLNVENSHYQESLDRGYDVEKIVNIPLNRTEQFDVLKKRLEQHPAVESVAGTKRLVGFTNESAFMSYEGSEHPVSLLESGANYPQVIGIRLIKGSFFTETESTSKEVLVNRMLESQFEESLLEKHIKIEDISYKVVGVVEDFNLRSIMMDNKINPTIITREKKNRYFNLVARVSGSSVEANRGLEEVWYEIYEDELYVGFPQSDVMNNAKELNRIMIVINSFLAIISILISIIGLYTLISLKALRKSKEFGVRKVLGASKGTIIHLLGKDLYWVMGIASIIGLISSKIVFGTVFDIIYAYHIEPDITHFLKSIAVVLLIVVFTIGYKVLQASNINPSQQLRTE
ncbi:MAG: FtsX-like permease family protein [Bacteroidota bacterium]